MNYNDEKDTSHEAQHRKPYPCSVQKLVLWRPSEVVCSHQPKLADQWWRTAKVKMYPVSSQIGYRIHIYKGFFCHQPQY